MVEKKIVIPLGIVFLIALLLNLYGYGAGMVQVTEWSREVGGAAFAGLSISLLQSTM